LYGSRRVDRSAQLALMDAMVFFAVSMVICATLASYALGQGTGASDAVYSPASPDELLSVYLGASIGEGFVLQGSGLELTGRETFGETLFVIAALLAQGHDETSFESVLAHCSAVLSGLCAPWPSILRLSLADGADWVVFLEVGQDASAGSDTASASQNLGECEGAPLMVTLVLSPALLPEGI